MSKYRNFPGPYILLFNLHIEKYRAGKTPSSDPFLSVCKYKQKFITWSNRFTFQRIIYFCLNTCVYMCHQSLQIQLDNRLD